MFDKHTVSGVPKVSEGIQSSLNPEATAYVASTVQPYPSVPRPMQQNQLGQSVTTELTRFLLKEGLLLSRLTCYNNRPESYATWKSGFTSIMKEYIEELDLLVKWLVPESSKYAISIRASNT